MPIVSAVILFICLFILVFLMPFFLIYPGGYPVNATGGIMACIFVSLFIVSPFSDALYDRIGSHLLFTLAMAIIPCSLFSLATIHANASFFQ